MWTFVNIRTTLVNEYSYHLICSLSMWFPWSKYLLECFCHLQWVYGVKWEAPGKPWLEHKRELSAYKCTFHPLNTKTWLPVELLSIHMKWEGYPCCHVGDRNFLTHIIKGENVVSYYITCEILFRDCFNLESASTIPNELCEALLE